MKQKTIHRIAPLKQRKQFILHVCACIYFLERYINFFNELTLEVSNEVYKKRKNFDFHVYFFVRFRRFYHLCALVNV